MTQKLTEMAGPVNALYTGDGGTGKTTALAAMANLGRVVAVNAEQGIEASALRKRGVDVSNIEVFPGPGEELSDEGLTQLWVKLREELHEDPEALAGVFWDPVSEIQQVFVEDLARESVDRAHRANRERSVHVKDQDNWTMCNSQMRSLIRKFRDLPCHFGMSAPLRRMQDDDSVVTYQPSVSPGLQNDLFGWCNVVCVTSVVLVEDEAGKEVEEFRGLFRPHGKWRGKDRLSVLPKWLVDPTFDRIVAYKDGDLEVESDPVMVQARERAQAGGDKTGAADTATEKKSKSKTKDKE